MEIFTDRADFERMSGGAPKWVRTAQALLAAPALIEGTMHSIGDSLTYLRTRRRHETDLFTGHRRYHEVVAAGSSSVELEIARKSALDSCDDYSDLSDREHFTGSGAPVRLEPGQILVTSIDEALRYVGTAGSPATVLHVSVEGATFPNK